MADLGWYFAPWIRIRGFSIFADPGNQNLADPTDPDPKLCFSSYLFPFPRFFIFPQPFNNSSLANRKLYTTAQYTSGKKFLRYKILNGTKNFRFKYFLFQNISEKYYWFIFSFPANSVRGFLPSADAFTGIRTSSTIIHYLQGNTDEHSFYYIKCILHNYSLQCQMWENCKNYWIFGENNELNCDMSMTKVFAISWKIFFSKIFTMFYIFGFDKISIKIKFIFQKIWNR